MSQWMPCCYPISSSHNTFMRHTQHQSCCFSFNDSQHSLKYLLEQFFKLTSLRLKMSHWFVRLHVKWFLRCSGESGALHVTSWQVCSTTPAVKDHLPLVHTHHLLRPWNSLVSVKHYTAPAANWQSCCRNFCGRDRSFHLLGSNSQSGSVEGEAF